MVGHRLMRLGQPVELLLGRPAPVKTAERLVERAAQHLGPERRGAVDQPVADARRPPARAAGSSEIGLCAASGISPTAVAASPSSAMRRPSAA